MLSVGKNSIKNLQMWELQNPIITISREFRQATGNLWSGTQKYIEMNYMKQSTNYQ